MRSNGLNHVWAVDFVHDKLSNNRPYKMLTVVDEYTRQALAVHVAHKMSAADILEALYPPHTIYVLTTCLSSQLKCFKSGLPR